MKKAFDFSLNAQVFLVITLTSNAIEKTQLLYKKVDSSN